MSNAAKRALVTWAKYIIWTGIAAGITAGLHHLTDLNLPIWIVPLVASALKALATYAATKARE